MPDQRLDTREQVRQYLARSLGSDREFRIMEFRHCWVCQPIPPSAAAERGRRVGGGRYVVNKMTGVITGHGSNLPPQQVGTEYDRAVETGQPIEGFQIYPPQWRTTFQRIREDQNEIEYRVVAQSLTVPQAERSEQILTIDKHTLRSRTDSGVIHPSSGLVTGWTQTQNRANGSWPNQGTIEH